MRRLLALVVVLASTAAGAAGAQAATRYASPTGAGAAPCTDAASPCRLGVAVAAAGAGDVVAAGAGEHHLAAAVQLLVPGVTVQGPAPGAPAVVVADGDHPVITVQAPGVTLRDLDLRGSTNLNALLTTLAGTSPLLERLAVREASQGRAAVLRSGLLRDSLVTSAASSGGAVVASAAQLVGVTVLAPEGDARAVQTTSQFASPGDRTTVRNAILHGGEGPGGKDLEAVGATFAVSLDVDRTSLDPSRTLQVDSGRIALGPGDQDRRTAVPRLEALTGRELPGSPTEDAGAPDAAQGAVDREGTPRAVGEPDLGADERTKPPTIAGANAAGSAFGCTPPRFRYELEADVTANGLPTSVVFELTEGAIVRSVPATPPAGAGTAAVRVTAATESPGATRLVVVAANADGTSRTEVAQPPVAVPPCVPIVRPDRTRPTLTRLALPHSVRRGRAAQARFTLSERSRVRLLVERVRTGHRRSGACRLRGARGPRCTRYLAAGLASRVTRAGSVRTALPLRTRGRALGPGTYRLTLTATDAAGNRSAVRRVRFRIR